MQKQKQTTRNNPCRLSYYLLDFYFLPHINEISVLDTIVLDQLRHSVSHHLLDGACRGLCGYRPVSGMSMRENIFTHLDNDRSENAIMPFAIGRKTGFSATQPTAPKQVPNYIHLFQRLRRMDLTQRNI